MNDQEREFQDLLRREEQTLGSPTLARIARARQTALGTPPAPRWLRFARPAVGAAVFASLLGVALVLPQAQQSLEADSAAGPDNPELYRELDFYIWLAESDMGRDG